jgi:MinD-like ATPase involved in chromosome partitioning or flagellar assembly
MKIKEELQEILDDHRSQIIDILKEDAEDALVVDVEANLDRMITEVEELLGSSYE